MQNVCDCSCVHAPDRWSGSSSGDDDRIDRRARHGCAGSRGARRDGDGDHPAGTANLHHRRRRRLLRAVSDSGLVRSQGGTAGVPQPRSSKRGRQAWSACGAGPAPSGRHAHRFGQRLGRRARRRPVVDDNRCGDRQRHAAADSRRPAVQRVAVSRARRQQRRSGRRLQPLDVRRQRPREPVRRRRRQHHQQPATAASAPIRSSLARSATASRPTSSRRRR